MVLLRRPLLVAVSFLPTREVEIASITIGVSVNLVLSPVLLACLARSEDSLTFIAVEMMAGIGIMIFQSAVMNEETITSQTICHNQRDSTQSWYGVAFKSIKKNDGMMKKSR